MFEQRTIYKIIDEHGAASSITLEKFVADILQKHLPDVHAWIQQEYDKVARKRPGISRIKQGDLVRLLAQREAEKYPGYDEFRLAEL
jgi:hypothetical protein